MALLPDGLVQKSKVGVGVVESQLSSVPVLKHGKRVSSSFARVDAEMFRRCTRRVEL